MQQQKSALAQEQGQIAQLVQQQQQAEAAAAAKAAQQRQQAAAAAAPPPLRLPRQPLVQPCGSRSSGRGALPGRV